MKSNFAVFILSNGRPNNIVTLNALNNSNYKGKVYILVDNEDKTQKEYKKIHGDKVIIFNKKAIAKKTDNGDNFNDLRTTTHVRNASFEIAKSLGIKYFAQLDDDYLEFQFRYNDKLRYKYKSIRDLNSIFETMIDFLKTTKCKSVAMAQGGDFLGGNPDDNGDRIRLKRKCMNSFICDVDNPFKIVGRLNEDVNTYVSRGIVGDLFFTTFQIMLNQKQTQAEAGGMSETYLESGTYVKSFYTVMYSPSSVKVAEMITKHRRLHHAISWTNTVPRIINEKHKKTK